MSDYYPGGYPNTFRGGPTGNSYVYLNDIDHLLQAPDMYIDSVYCLPRKEFVMINGKIGKIDVSIAPAVIRTITEVIANAMDNGSRSRGAFVDPGIISVTITGRNVISVYNEGLPMAVEMNTQLGMLAPTMNFGVPRTSSNFTTHRTEVGKNGYGAKATNIYATKFHVEIVDLVRGLHFEQTWTNNMKTVGDPIVIPAVGYTKSFVRVTWEMDWSRLNLPYGMPNGLPDEVYYIVARICADTSMAGRIPVHFAAKIDGGYEANMNYSSIVDYARLYHFGDFKNYLLHYQWPAGTPVDIMPDRTQRSKNGVRPEVELLLIDTPGQGGIISFANSMMTPDGGVHAKAALTASTSEILESINGKKGNDSKTSGPGPKLTVSDAKKHISIIVSVQVTNPSYDGQSKKELRSPAVTISYPPGFLNPINKWDFAERLKEDLKAKQMKKLSDTDGKKTKYLNNDFKDKYDDAGDAGTARSEDCIAMVVEGDSASAYALYIIGFHPQKRRKLGIIRLRGKLRNAINATPLELSENKEIKMIKAVLGLKEGMNYLDPKNKSTLRYGQLMILTDQDVDGLHIKGLLFTFFNQYYPTLLQSGFVVSYLTPYLRATNEKQPWRSTKFFYEKEFEEWKKSNLDWEDEKLWTYKYLKGLGSSSKEEAFDDYKDCSQHIVKMVYDEYAKESIDLAFNDKRSNDRKRWIMSYNPNTPTPVITTLQTISGFIHHEMIGYPIACLKRHINALDGNKESQRKVIYTIYKRWNIGIGAKYKEKKIANLASATSEETNYHHGDSLPQVIVNMAYDFVGSKNLPFFTQKSALGTRDQGGRDAAQPRYTLTTPNWWVPYIFMKEDKRILDTYLYNTDDGQQVEPKLFLPIIPMHVVNGANGIGTGWMTLIPNHHPLDTVDQIVARLDGRKPPPIKPWYRGFNGEIHILDKRKEKPLFPDMLIIDLAASKSDEKYTISRAREAAATAGSSGRYSMITTGCFDINSKGNVVVTELPIGMWTADYRKWVNKIREEGRITDFEDMSDGEVVSFELMNFVPLTKPNENRLICDNMTVITAADLNLVSSYGMGNMNILDENGIPRRYNNVDEVIDHFCEFRLPYYQKRKNFILEDLKKEAQALTMRINFILSVINGQIVLIMGNKRSRKRADIHADMVRFGYDTALLKSVNSDDYTEEKVAKLRQKLGNVEEKIINTLSTSIEMMWMQDLKAFYDAYVSHYGNDRIKKNLSLQPVPVIDLSSGPYGVFTSQQAHNQTSTQTNTQTSTYSAYNGYPANQHEINGYAANQQAANGGLIMM